MPPQSRRQKDLPKGPLTEPIAPFAPPPKGPFVLDQIKPNSREEYNQALAKWRHQTTIDLLMERFRKLTLLLDHYEIEKDDDDRWFKLASELANQFVPGFSLKQMQGKKIGAPNKWDDNRYLDLYSTVIAMHKGRAREGKQPMSDMDVCRQLAKKTKWANVGSAKTLANEYLKAKKSMLVKMFINAQADPDIEIDVFEMIFNELNPSIDQHQ